MKKIILILIVLGAVGGGAAAVYMRNGTPEPVVTTMALSRGDIAETVQATATLEALETVDVGTQVSGVVMELGADYNSIVRKGQIIARLDPSIIQTQIEQARANVTRSETDLERLKIGLADAERKWEQAKQMWDKQLIPKDQLDTADLNVKTQRSQIQSAQAGLVQTRSQLNTQQVNLSHTVIKSPIDGIVISRNVQQGQTVAASMNAPVLYKLAADLTKMRALASIDESDIGRMRPGQSVTFSVDAYPSDRFVGTVEQIRLLPVTVQNVVTYATVITVPNPEYKLKPGMTADVTIEVARRMNVLRAPAAALRFRPTNDMFAALKQEVPADLNRGMGRGNQGGPGGRGGRGTPSGAAAPGATPAQPSAATPPSANQAKPTPATPQARTQPDSVRQGGGERGGDRPAGERGARGNMTPEEREARRKQMEERMKNMSPEERERVQQRMAQGGAGRGRGGDGAATRQAGQAGQAGQAVQGGRGANPSAPRNPGTGARDNQPASRLATTTATTVDALFAPLVMTEGRGRVWRFITKQLSMVNVRTGISDGTWIEIIEGGEGTQLEAGTEVVTHLVTGLEPVARPGQQSPGGNPLMPQQPQRGMPGGGRGR